MEQWTLQHRIFAYGAFVRNGASVTEVRRLFLWGFLKSRVYNHKPRTLAELKDAIKNEVAAVDQQLLQRVQADFLKRIENCIKENGHYLIEFIFH